MAIAIYTRCKYQIYLKFVSHLREQTTLNTVIPLCYSYQLMADDDDNNYLCCHSFKTLHNNYVSSLCFQLMMTFYRRFLLFSQQ